MSRSMILFVALQYAIIGALKLRDGLAAQAAMWVAYSVANVALAFV